VAPQPRFFHDDDIALVPRPYPSVFAPRAGARPAAADGNLRGLFFRRTMIPILLTCGTILGALGGLWFTLDIDAPLRAGAGAWVPTTLLILAAMLLALAVLNMLQVRHLLRVGRRVPR
jgi:hypothetical protein